MRSNTQILSDLEIMAKNGQPVSLLNIFKGVPVACKATVQEVHSDRAVFMVEPPESTSLVWDRQTWIQGGRLFEAVKARVLSFDIVTGLAELDSFQYAGSRLGQRSAVRVEPKNTIRVTIESNSQQIVGTLADISTIGVGVYVYPMEGEDSFKRAEEVKLSMRLPDSDVTMQGKVRGLVKLADYYRVSIHFTANQPENAVISSYIVKRRAEILEELPRLYEELLRHQQGVT